MRCNVHANYECGEEVGAMVVLLIKTRVFWLEDDSPLGYMRIYAGDWNMYWTGWTLENKISWMKRGLWVGDTPRHNNITYVHTYIYQGVCCLMYVCFHISW